jgi:hypothetical protein
MSDNTVDHARRVRQLLRLWGVASAVSTSWNEAGTKVVVVDLAPEVDRNHVADQLANSGLDVVIRGARRELIAH